MLGLLRKARSDSDTDKTYDLRYRLMAPDSKWEIRSNNMRTIRDVEEEVLGLTGLVPDAKYEFQIRLVGDLGHGGWTDSAIIAANRKGTFID